MVLRLVIWNLADSQTNVGELRRYLRDEAVPAFEQVPGLLSKGWFSDEVSERWGAVYVWESQEASEQELPPGPRADREEPGHRRGVRPRGVGVRGRGAAPARAGVRVSALRIERDGAVLRIAMARPERRNAFDASLIEELTGRSPTSVTCVR